MYWCQCGCMSVAARWYWSVTVLYERLLPAISLPVRTPQSALCSARGRSSDYRACCHISRLCNEKQGCVTGTSDDDTFYSIARCTSIDFFRGLGIPIILILILIGICLNSSSSCRPAVDRLLQKRRHPHHRLVWMCHLCLVMCSSWLVGRLGRI